MLKPINWYLIFEPIIGIHNYILTHSTSSCDLGLTSENLDSQNLNTSNFLNILYSPDNECTANCCGCNTNKMTITIPTHTHNNYNTLLHKTITYNTNAPSANCMIGSTTFTSIIKSAAVNVPAQW